jgi:hypothetical protein
LACVAYGSDLIKNIHSHYKVAQFGWGLAFEVNFAALTSFQMPLFSKYFQCLSASCRGENFEPLDVPINLHDSCMGKH